MREAIRHSGTQAHSVISSVVISSHPQQSAVITSNQPSSVAISAPLKAALEQQLRAAHEALKTARARVHAQLGREGRPLGVNKLVHTRGHPRRQRFPHTPPWHVAPVVERQGGPIERVGRWAGTRLGGGARRVQRAAVQEREAELVP